MRRTPQRCTREWGRPRRRPLHPHGPRRPSTDVDEIGRDPGLCSSAILQYEPRLVTDAKLDPRTLTNPLVVGQLGLRFYAGAPLTTREGYNVGTLNVIDTEPREAARREEQRLELLKSAFVATASQQLRTPLAGV